MTARRVVALLAAVLLAPLLGGCAGDTESYCDEVTERTSELQRLADAAGEPGADLVGDSLQVFRTLGDEAPDDLSDEWETFVLAWQDLADALADAEVDVTEFDPQTRSEGITPGEYDAVRDAAARLRSPSVVDAAGGIEQHSLDVCKVDLSTGGLDF